MTKNLNKGISSIQYNVLNLPQTIEIKSPIAEAKNEYLYSALEEKLRVIQKWNRSYQSNPIIGTSVNNSLLTATKTTDYVGNKVYENGTLKRILTQNGYIENGRYYFYIKDYLGNNRAVLTDYNTQQLTDFYPFGMAFLRNMDNEIQPYKFGAKEYDSMHGINQYDFHARQYDPAEIRFTTVDPMAEKYYSISPYVYCGNNPVNMIDPDGREIKIWFQNEDNKWQTWIFNGENQDKAPKNQFVNNFISAYNYNVKNGGGDNLKKATTSTDYTINLTKASGGSARQDMDTGKPQLESFVTWNTELGLETKEGYLMSPATVLEHEMDHAVRHTTIEDFSVYRKESKYGTDHQYDSIEEKRVITGSEAKTARANGEFPKGYVRKDHKSGRSIITSSSISNKKTKHKNQ